MSARDEQSLAANWERMGRDIERAAVEFQRTADALREIKLKTIEGARPSPESIISRAALVMSTSIEADLIHRLATWAGAINDIQRHLAEEQSR